MAVCAVRNASALSSSPEGGGGHAPGIVRVRLPPCDQPGTFAATEFVPLLHVELTGEGLRVVETDVGAADLTVDVGSGICDAEALSIEVALLDKEGGSAGELGDAAGPSTRGGSDP